MMPVSARTYQCTWLLVGRHILLQSYVYSFADIYRQHSVNFLVNKYVHSYLIASSLIFLLRHVCNYKLKIILPGVQYLGVECESQCFLPSCQCLPDQSAAAATRWRERRASLWQISKKLTLWTTSVFKSHSLCLCMTINDMMCDKIMIIIIIYYNCYYSDYVYFG